MGRSKLLIGGMIATIVIVFVIIILVSAGGSHTAQLAPTNNTAASVPATAPIASQSTSSAVIGTVTPANTPVSTSTPTSLVSPPTGTGNSAASGNSSASAVHSSVNSASNPVPAGATAQCADGSYSFSLSLLGACVGHGGISVSLNL